MVRLKHTATGVVVVVSEETASKLNGYAPEAEPKKAAPKKASSK